MGFEQFSLFDYTMPPVSINKPIRLVELFSGVGAQAMALRNLGVEFEYYKTCEWEIHAIAAYNAIHIKDNTDYSQDMTDEEIVQFLTSKGISTDGKVPLTEQQIRSHQNGVEWRKETYNNIMATHNLVNVSQAKGEDLGIVDTDRYIYMLTWSFPCTDLSLAGKRQGMEEGSGTASSLSWEVLRILSECENKPQILIMENVPEVHGVKNIEGFQEICSRLQELGYTNWYEDMNARDYGVAQNRERCFMVSILGEYNYKFPVSMELTKTMNDYLDDEVDDRYYINTQKAHDLIVDLQKRGQLDGVVKNVSEGQLTS